MNDEVMDETQHLVAASSGVSGPTPTGESSTPLSTPSVPSIPLAYRTTLDQNIIHQQQQYMQYSNGPMSYQNQSNYQCPPYQPTTDHAQYSHDFDDTHNVPEFWQDGFDMEGVYDVDDCSSCCLCCLCQFFSTLFYCFSSLLLSPKFESFRRAVCFGAIDGMLTGSGIVSATLGFQLFPHLYFSMMNSDYYPSMSNLQNDYRTGKVCASGTTEQQGYALIALTLAACCADGLCMGFGHIWSTFILHDGATKERQETALLYQTNRLHSKVNLLEMLMSRGMLKADAIQIVDILEGYPDIFVSASLGDIQGSGPLGLAGDNVNDTSREPSGRQNSNGHINSMGRFNNSYGESEYVDESGDDFFIVMESISEGFIMTFVFAVFSVVPAIIHIYTPRILNYVYGSQTSLKEGGVHPATVTISILNLIMVLLGFWKSQFFGANWILFGVETVVVLVVCIFVAYLIGASARIYVT